MKLYALSRPLPRGRTNIALIANGDSVFFKFDTYAHTGHLGISPTGYKADTVTVEVDADTVESLSIAESGSLHKRMQSVAMHITNLDAIEFVQKGDSTEIILKDNTSGRPASSFVLSVDVSGK